MLFADKSLIRSEKFPVIFAGNFCAEQGENPEKLRVCSIVGCVKLPKKYRFLQKIPCFSLFLTLSFVCRAQVFHKPKVKGFLHRQEYDASRGNPTGCSFSPRSRRFLTATLPVYIAGYTKTAQTSHNYIPCPKSRCQFWLIFYAICDTIQSI